MSYSVQFMSGASVLYAFPSPTPFTAPHYTYEYDDQQPPKLALVHRVLTLEGILYGTESNLWTSFVNNLTASVESGNVTGIQLLQDANVVLDISKIQSYDSFKIESLESIESSRRSLQWRSEIKFKIKVSATKKIGPPIAKLMQQETWSYDEAGLLTLTLTGEVITPSGTSSVAQAQTLGLALPSSSFAFVTNGPGGVDVFQADRSDTTARFTSTIRQVGSPLPGGVGPSFSVTSETTFSRGEQVTTTTVSARGTGALAAVQGKAPAGTLAESRVSSDPFQLTASAVYVQKAPASGNVTLKVQRFDSKGGGRPLKWSTRTGGKNPVKHRSAFVPIEIRESVRVEFVGSPGLSALTYPQALPGLDQDESQLQIVGPERIEIGKDPGGDKWRLEVHRLYYDTDFNHALNLAAIYALTPRSSAGLTNADLETSSQPKGKD